MLNKKLGYENCTTEEQLHELLYVFFGEKHFHVELCLGAEMAQMASVSEMLREARKLVPNDGGASQKYLELLRRCAPSKVTHFSGLKKFKNLWWAAVVELIDPTQGYRRVGTTRKFQSYTALLIGWHNDKHGGSGTVVTVGDSEDIDAVELVMSHYELRSEEKEHGSRKYKRIVSLEPNAEEDNFADLKPPEDLPVIPGLGEPKPRAGKSLVEVFSAPSVSKEPTPAPSKKSKSKKTETPKPLKAKAPKKTARELAAEDRALVKQQKQEDEKAVLSDKMKSRKRVSDW